MRTTELYLDPTHPEHVHASLTCEHNTGLVALAEDHRGEAVDELDALLHAVAELGLAVPAWSARGLRYCPHCTLVATADWAVAA